MAVAGGEWRSQAARFAASSSCMMIGDFAGEPLFMRAPCSHFEQTRTRGSDAAVTPAWPQVGQTIRVNMRGSLAQFGLSRPHRLSAVDLLVAPHPLGRGAGAAGGNRRPAPGKAVEPKLRAFYDSLDAKQKEAFDTGGRIGGIFDWWGKK